MKRILALSLAVAGVVLMGCTQNEIEIRNEASGAVYFLFRGTEHFVAAGASATVGGDADPIPNNTFAYSTTYEIPAAYTTSVADGDLAGTLSFFKSQTRYVLLYSSSYTRDSSGNSYEIHCNRSSNDPVGGGTTAP